MRKKLPRVLASDYNKIINQITQDAQKAEQAVKDMNRENPLLVEIIRSHADVMQFHTSIDQSQTSLVEVALTIYTLLTEALQREPDIITKSDNDSLPTISEQTVSSVFDRFSKMSQDDRYKKLEKIKIEIPAINQLINLSNEDFRGLINEISLTKDQAIQVAVFALSQIILVYEIFRSQAESNKMKKMFGSNTDYFDETNDDSDKDPDL